MASDDITDVLLRVEAGQSAAGQLMPLVYGELRDLAEDYLQRERPGHTLQPTALVNEAYLRMVDQSRIHWRGRTHFFAVSSQMMRRILVDHARRQQRLKRGGNEKRIALHDDMKISSQSDEDLLAVDEALVKLSQRDPRQAKIVELRFFGGLTVAEVADVLGVAKRTIEAEWTMIRAWLRRELSERVDG